jgi:hypothetical protein
MKNEIDNFRRTHAGKLNDLKAKLGIEVNL